MKQWTVIFKKEMLEHARSIKWIWVPIVFIILGVMDPLMSYYMPKILDAVGGLPEGAVIDIPMPSPAEALFMSISEFDFIGLIIIALISMSLISGELKSGVYELVLSKPVKYGNYITAKWAGMAVLIFVSLLVGFLGSYYYVQILFGDLAFSTFITAFFIYFVYLLFFITIAVFVNTWFNRPGMVFFLTFVLTIVVDIITSIFGHYLTWSPGHISSYVFDLLKTDSIPSETWGTLGVTAILIVIMLYLATSILRKKEL